MTNSTRVIGDLISPVVCSIPERASKVAASSKVFVCRQVSIYRRVLSSPTIFCKQHATFQYRQKYRQLCQLPPLNAPEQPDANNAFRILDPDEPEKSCFDEHP